MPKIRALNVEDATQFGIIVFSWLLELEKDPSELNKRIIGEFHDIYGRLLDSISINNCALGKLEVVELSPKTVEIFEYFQTWAAITFPLQTKKHKNNLN